MLNITPTSWISGLYPVRLFGSVDTYASFVALDPDHSPICIGNRPKAGHQTIVGDRPVDHYQFHGDAVYNDVDNSYAESVVIPREGSYPSSAHDIWVPNNGILYHGISSGMSTSYVSAFQITGGEHLLSYDRMVNVPDGDSERIDASSRSYMGRMKDGTFYSFSCSVRPRYQSSGPYYYAKVEGLVETIAEPAYLYGCDTVEWRRIYRDAWEWIPQCFRFDTETLWTMPAKRSSGQQILSHSFYLPPMSKDAYNEHLATYPGLPALLCEELCSQLMQWLKAGYQSSNTDNKFTPDWRYDHVETRTCSAKWIRDLYQSVSQDCINNELQEDDLKTYLGDSTSSAADAAKAFQGNLIAYVKDIQTLKSTISSAFDILHGRVSIKKLANAWLSSRYGLKLTIQDTMELLKGIQHTYKKLSDGKLVSTCRGGTLSDTSTYHCKLYYRPDLEDNLQKVLATAVEWDLYPNLENIWDLIPYSFVVDWFVRVGDVLNAVDNMAYLDQVHVIATCYSVKKTWKADKIAHTVGLCGDVSYSRYMRLCPSEPYQYVPHFSGNVPSAKNIVDGTALIIQRI